MTERFFRPQRQPLPPASASIEFIPIPFRLNVLPKAGKAGRVMAPQTALDTVFTITLRTFARR